MWGENNGCLSLSSSGFTLWEKSKRKQEREQSARKTGRARARKNGNEEMMKR